MDFIFHKNGAEIDDTPGHAVNAAQGSSMRCQFTLSESEIRRLIEGVARRQRINQEDVEDFVSECWLATETAKATFKGGSERAFVISIARNRALNTKRAYVYKSSLKARLDTRVAVTEQMSMPSRESLLSLKSALAGLGDQELDVLRLHFFEGRTLQEASTLLGLRYGRAYSTLQGALTKLRQTLGDMPQSKPRRPSLCSKRVFFIIFPIVFLAAVTGFAMMHSDYLNVLKQNVLQGLGCFLRDAPFEYVDLSSGTLPCERRERGFVRFALFLNEHRSYSGETLALLESFLRGEESDATVKFADALDTLGLTVSSVVNLHAGISSANAAYPSPPLTSEAAPLVEPLTPQTFNGLIAPADRTNLVLERFALDYCGEDGGWEFGCDREEMVVLWILIGPGYFSFGLSPMLTNVKLEMPFEGALKMPAYIEFGLPPPEFHVFSTVLDIDTGGPPISRILDGLATTLTAMYVLHGESFGSMHGAEIGKFSDLFLFSLRILAGEHDCSDFSHDILDRDSPGNVVVEHWPTGSYYISLRVSQ